MHKQTVMLSMVLTLLAGCGEAPTQSTNDNAVRPVKTYVVSGQVAQTSTTFPGVIGTKNLTELSFSTGGRVIEFSANESMVVEAGSVIAKLDQRELDQQLSKAESQYKVVRDEYERLATLSKSGAVSKSTLQAKQTERDVALSQLEIAREAVNDSVLLSPFTGVIAQTFIEEGQVISSGQTVAILIGEGELDASIDVPSTFLTTLYQTSKTDASLQSWVSLDSDPQVRFPAHINEVTLVADQATQTYAVTFSFAPDTDVLVLPGMNVSVEVTNVGGENSNAMYIPLDAISSDPQGTFVWVLDSKAQAGSQSVTKQHVVLRQAIGDKVPVAEGLSEGDVIVAAGVSQLSEGMDVRVWEDQ